jgi:hypothetical protein
MPTPCVATGGQRASAIAVRVFDLDLTPIWSADFGGTVYGVAVDSNNNVYAAGVRNNIIGGTYASVRKYNSSGTIIWSLDTGASTRRVRVDSADNLYIGGAGPYPDINLTTWKYDSNGNFLWSADHGDSITGIGIDSSGNVYTAGQSYYIDKTTRKYTSAGVPVWSILEHDYGLADATVKGNYLYTVIDNFEEALITTVNKRNLSDGSLVWSTNAVGSMPYGVDVDGLGNVYVAEVPADGASVKKFSSNGTLVWSVARNNSDYSIVLDRDCNSYVGGVSTPDGKALRKYDLDGNFVSSVASGGVVYYTAVTSSYLPIEEEPGPVQTLNEIILSYPKSGTPKKASKTRVLDRAIGAGALIYDTRKREYDLSFTWEPVTSEQREDLKEAYLSAYNSKVLFTDQDDTVYTVYTDNWKSKYLARSDTTYLYSISFNLVGTSS